MAGLIEDYAIVGDGATAALIGKDGAMDWLCLPRFDSGACFAALLGTAENGRWLLCPVKDATVTRRYRPGTLVLETTFHTAEGEVTMVDCMDRHHDHPRVFRLLRGVRGRVPMRLELTLRFDYGSIVPWVTRIDERTIRAIAGPDQVIFRAEVALSGEDLKTVARFTMEAGRELSFCLAWSPSHLAVPQPLDVPSLIEHVTTTWQDWSRQYTGSGPWREAVVRSLITLKALTNHSTGGIVAAATTSLPEEVGGERNWDYRYCWLRDATFTLLALLGSGFHQEARAWRQWLLRAIAGSPEQMQIMYGVAGERRLTEWEVPWLAGYGSSKPVRIGNAASSQLQLDVYGEVLDMLTQARESGLSGAEATWSLERTLVEHLTKVWDQPDEGIWEVRGGPRQFTYSKVMAWVALDRAVRSATEFQLEAPVAQWSSIRDAIHEEICRRGFSASRNAFTQSYGNDDLDASLLLLPVVGFLPANDPRILGTVAAIEHELVEDGLVRRYRTRGSVDGLRGTEGAFLACSFWLADNYALQGRQQEARDLFERLLSLRNDVGLLAEEYDGRARRQLGNFPQAFSHVALVNTAHTLDHDFRPAQHRSRRAHPAGSTRLPLRHERRDTESERPLSGQQGGQAWI